MLPDYNDTGALFRVEERKSSKHPLFSGKAHIQGEDWSMGAWPDGEDLNVSINPKGNFDDDAKVQMDLVLSEDKESYSGRFRDARVTGQVRECKGQGKMPKGAKYLSLKFKFPEAESASQPASQPAEPESSPAVAPDDIPF